MELAIPLPHDMMWLAEGTPISYLYRPHLLIVILLSATSLIPAPEAGTWFQAYFEQLIVKANPAF